MSLALTVGVLLGGYGLLLSLRHREPIAAFDPAPYPASTSLPGPQRLSHRANFEPATAGTFCDQRDREVTLAVTLRGPMPAAPEAGVGVLAGDTRTLMVWVPAARFEGSGDLRTVHLRVPANRALSLRWATAVTAVTRSYWSEAEVPAITEAGAAEVPAGRFPVRVLAITDGAAPVARALLQLTRQHDPSWRPGQGVGSWTDENGVLQLELGEGSYMLRATLDETAAPISFTVPGATEVRLTLPAPTTGAGRP